MRIKNQIRLLSNPGGWYYVIMCLFGVMYYITALSNHYYFRTPTFDYGIYNLAFWQYVHFHTGPCSLYSVFGLKKMNFLQDHFSFTLFYFIPIYWLLNWLTGTYTLMIIEITMVLIGGWAIYKLVIFKTSDKWLGVLSLLYYFLMQGHYSFFSSDCNILVIASCFVPLFLYFFETKRTIPATVIFIMLLLSREDMPLWLIFIFLVLMIWHRKEIKKVFICFSGIALCIIYFILVFTVFIPHTQDTAFPYRLFEYSVLGKTPALAFFHILKHPFDTFILLFKNQTGIAAFNGVKKEFYLVYLISGGFILFYRPYYFIWFAPVIAQKMLNDVPIRWSIEGYYAIEVATLLPLSVFLILNEIKTQAVIKRTGGIILCVLAAGVTIHTETTTPHALRWINTSKENIFNKAHFNPSYNAALIHKELKLIPPDAPVSASENITPHLAQRNHIYEFPDVENAQYIAAFISHDYYMISDSTYTADLDSYMFNPHWAIIAGTRRFIILKKETNDYKRITHFTCGAEKITNHGDSLLTSDGGKIQMGGVLDTNTVHNGKYSVKLTSSHPYAFTYHLKNIKVGDLIKLSIWRYSDNGVIALSFGTNNIIYSGKPVCITTDGWQKITLNAFVPGGCQSLFFYIWNPAPKPAFVDDLQADKYSR